MKSLLIIFWIATWGITLQAQKILAETNTPGEIAVQGINSDNTSSSSYGLYGKSYHGLQVIADGTDGFAGIGTANGLNGIGFYGISTASQGRGILGLHNNITGTAAGVEGRSASTAPSAVGVLGEITSTSPGGLSAGIRGINKGTGGLGIGVYGSHDGNGWGVHGNVPLSSTGWGGYFTGGNGLYAAPKLGINTLSPIVELVVSQTIAADNYFDQKLDNLTGLMIETVNDSATLIYVDPVFDLNFAFGSGTSFIQRSYIFKPNGQYASLSDRQLKKNIVPMNIVLDKVLELKPSWYSFKNDPTDQYTMGFIAQEVQTLFPEIVHEKGGKLSLVYDDFAVLAIKAIQEQQEVIEKMSERIEMLESIISNQKPISKDGED